MTAVAKLAAAFQAIASDVKALYSALAEKAAVSDLDPQLFYKADPYSPAFTKTSADTLSVNAGTGVMVAGIKVMWEFDTAVILPTLTPGTDYAIYACVDGSLRADADWSAPAGYTTATSRKVGGFHYGLVAPGTTPADGGFNTATSTPLISMIWTQTDVDHLAGINVFSLWDVKYRPACPDPRGMACVAGSFWVDIYFCSTDHLTNGTSKYLTNIANGGTVLPKIPLTFGGDGTTPYTTFSWFEAAEIARSHGKRLMSYPEFAAAAFGVTENQSLGGDSASFPARPGKRATPASGAWSRLPGISGSGAIACMGWRAPPVRPIPTPSRVRVGDRPTEYPIPRSSVGRAIMGSAQARVRPVGLTRHGVQSGVSGCGRPVTTYTWPERQGRVGVVSTGGEACLGGGFSALIGTNRGATVVTKAAQKSAKTRATLHWGGGMSRHGVTR